MLKLNLEVNKFREFINNLPFRNHEFPNYELRENGHSEYLGHLKQGPRIERLC